MDMFYKLAWFFKQEKKAYIIGIVMLILVGLLTGLVPMILGQMVDALANGSMKRDKLLMWSLLLLAIALAQYGIRYVWRMNIFGTSAKLARLLRFRLFDHYIAMDQDFFQKYRTGDLMARATNDLGAIRMVAGAGILTLFDSITQGLITLFMMTVWVDWRLTLVTIIPIPFLTLFIRVAGARLNYYSKQAQAAFAGLNDKVQESVNGAKVIKTFGQEDLDIKDFKRMTKELVAKNKQVIRFDSSFRPASQLIMGFATMIGLFYGSYLTVQGDLTIGHLVAFISYISRLSWPMTAVGRLFNILERGSASYDRVQELLGEESHIIEKESAISQAVDGPIDFKVQSFTYPGDDQSSLEDICFHLEKGQTLGIVGKTGSGKSTIFKLLMRDFDLYQGSISYNGINIKDYRLASLYDHIGYVPQDNFLFSRSIFDNIAFAKPEASLAEVERVARLASLDQDIQTLPEAYDTLVGVRGVTLSGGQQQRVSIARALLVNPSILILDDSLSAVDAKTESRILNAIKANRQGQTTVISAHRMSSVMHADEILVIDQGHIIERGSHQDLMQKGGWYQRTFESQQLETEGGEWHG